MPYHYAHYRFGRELIPGLSPSQRQCIGRFRRMYDMGLQGPDIFFYHLPFWKTEQGALGNKFHSQSGQVFFPQVCAAAKSEAAQAYLYGLLAHYCLDAACHPYVNQLVAIGEARHIALESEFDRHLLEKDGIPAPHTYDMSKRFHLTRGECMTVAACYPGATGAGISRSVRFKAFSTRFLASPNRGKREKLLRRVKPDFCEFFLEPGPVEALGAYVAELQECYRQALQAYPGLLEELLEHRRTGEALSDAFAPSFDG